MESLIKNSLSTLDEKISAISDELSSLINSKIKEIPSQKAKSFLASYRSYEKSLINLKMYVLYVKYILEMFKKVYDNPINGSQENPKNDKVLCLIMKKISTSEYKVCQNTFVKAKKQFINYLKKYSKRNDFIQDITKLMNAVENVNVVNPNYFKDRHLSIMSIWEKTNISKNDIKKLNDKIFTFTEFNDSDINKLEMDDFKDKLSELLDKLDELISEVEETKQ